MIITRNLPQIHKYFKMDKMARPPPFFKELQTTKKEEESYE